MREHRVRMVRCRIERAIDERGIPALLGQGETGLARLAHAGNEVERRRFARRERQAAADCGDRIEHGPALPDNGASVCIAGGRRVSVHDR